MDASAFDADLARALGLCRAAADLRLPIEAMIEHVEDLLVSSLPAASEMLGPDSADPRFRELEALREILAAVGDVAAIGAKLPQESPCAPPLEPDFPMPANLRGA